MLGNTSSKYFWKCLVIKIRFWNSIKDWVLATVFPLQKIPESLACVFKIGCSRNVGKITEKNLDWIEFIVKPCNLQLSKTGLCRRCVPQICQTFRESFLWEYLQLSRWSLNIYQQDKRRIELTTFHWRIDWTIFKCTQPYNNEWELSNWASIFIVGKPTSWNTVEAAYKYINTVEILKSNALISLKK